MAVINNHDIGNLVKRLKRFRKELVASVSAGLQEVSASDKQRLVSYLEAAKAFKDWAVSAPELDLPYTSPMTIEVEDEELGEVVNEDLDVVIDLLLIIERELLGSQSARRSGSLVDHDSIRFDASMAKVEHFLSNYMDSINPLDLPETVTP